MFTIIFTAATVVLFLSAILGRPRSWYMSAFANAAGATLGTAVLLLLVRERGLSYLNETFPTVLASPAWAKATALMTPQPAPLAGTCAGDGAQSPLRWC